MLIDIREFGAQDHEVRWRAAGVGDPTASWASR
jgi:hypothetical protein